MDIAQQEILYKKVGQRELMLTFLPPFNKIYKRAPLYFLITGGGWRECIRANMIGFSQASVSALRDKGYAVVSIDYRTIREEGIYIRDVIVDCFDALCFVCKNADKLGIDTNNITLSGHSAGGHLSLMLAYADSKLFVNSESVDYRITSVAAFSPITALYGDYAKETLNLGDLSVLFGTEDFDEMGKRVSPLEYVTKKCPPTILCAGTCDNLVSHKSSELLYEKLAENDVSACLALSEFGGHCYEQVEDGKIPDVSLEQMQNIAVEFILENTSELSERI